MDILSLRRASVGARLAMLSCALVAAIFAAFTFAVTRTAGTQISDQVLSRISEKDRSIAAMISLFDKALTAEVGRSMTLFASFLPPGYALDETQKIDIAGTPTPVFKAGDKVLNNDFSIPDQFLAQSGAIATIFARTGDDFVRVTTSLKKQDGSRAIGTLLDRKGPAYGPVAGNTTFTGLATLFGKRYITQYRPITDASGKVIGALFVGVDVDAQIKSVEDGIRQLKIGDTGYYFVLNASNGAERGKLLVHPAAAGQMGDESAAPYKRMLDEKEGQIEYTSADATLGESGAQDKFVSFVSVPEWSWLVGGVAKRDEVMADVIATRNRFILIGFVLVALFAVVFLIAVRRLVTRPLDEAAKASERFASGDLSVRVSASHERRADEIGRLMQAIDGIGEGLARIVTQVRSASADMTEGTAKIVRAAARSRRASARRPRVSKRRRRACSRSRRRYSRTPVTRHRRIRWCRAHRKRPSTAAARSNAWFRRWARSASRRRRSPTSRRSSKALRSRPTSSRSTRPWKRRVPASTARGLRWLRRKCARLRSAVRRRRRKSRA